MKKIKLLLLILIFSNNIFGQSIDISELNKLFKEKKYEECIKLSVDLEKYHKSDSALKIIIVNRADCYMTLAKFELAIKEWDKLINIDTTNYEYFLNKSYADWQIGKYDECLENIKKAYEINPGDIWVLSSLSYYNTETHNYKEGLKYANIGLKRNDLNDLSKANLLNNRGYAYLGLEQFDKALLDINKSIKLNPNNSFAFYFRALANIGKNQNETVCKDLKIAKNLGAVQMTKELIIKYCNK